MPCKPFTPTTLTDDPEGSKQHMSVRDTQPEAPRGQEAAARPYQGHLPGIPVGSGSCPGARRCRSRRQQRAGQEERLGQTGVNRWKRVTEGTETEPTRVLSPSPSPCLCNGKVLPASRVVGRVLGLGSGWKTEEVPASVTTVGKKQGEV